MLSLNLTELIYLIDFIVGQARVRDGSSPPIGARPTAQGQQCEAVEIARCTFF